MKDKEVHPNPLVSVIVPTKNRAELLAKSILSILNQDYKNVEILVIDDGSIDNTKTTIEKIKSEKIRYFYQDESSDIAKLRNIGISYAKGDILAFCDDDDLWSSNKLSVQIPYLRKYDAVCTNADLINSADEYMGLPMNDELYESQLLTTEKLMLGNVVVTPSLTVKKESLCHLFIERNSRYSIEDYELWLKLSLSITIFYINEKLVQVRKHNNNTTSFDKNVIYIKLLKQVIFILDEYKNYNRKGIRKCALIGKLKQHKELSKVYFKNHHYILFLIEFFKIIFKSFNITALNYFLFKKNFELKYVKV